MANIASVLKEEIARVARKEIRRETSSLKKASTAYRSEIAALKRRMLELERRLRRGAANTSARIASNEDSNSASIRYSAKSVASQRRRLGLSAAECGLLVGASAQSIYNWEAGKARPRAENLAAVVALRTLGRRSAAELVAARRHDG